MKQESKAKEKANAEVKGKPEPKAKPFPYHLVAAQGSRSQQGGSSGSGRRVPTPPPPPSKPAASSSTGSHWIDDLKDDRKIWKDPKVPDRGNPSGASSSSAPRVTLQPNVDSAAEFNDKRSDHRWVIVPALDGPLQWELKIAKVARDLANLRVLMIVMVRCRSKNS